MYVYCVVGMHVYHVVGMYVYHVVGMYVTECIKVSIPVICLLVVTPINGTVLSIPHCTKLLIVGGQ
jgi:hypothetical protein